MYGDLLRLIFRDLGRRKFSSALTFLAISLGILAIFMIIIIGAGFENSIEKELEQFGSNRLYISPLGGFGLSPSQSVILTDRELRLIESRPYVKEAYPYYMRYPQIQYGNDARRVQGLGVRMSQEFFDDLNMELDRGRIPREQERYAIVLGSLAASDTFQRPIPVGASIEFRGHSFRVVGILKSFGNPQDDAIFYFNMNTLQELFGEEDITFINAVIVESYDVELARDNLKSILENRLGKDSVDVVTQDQLMEQFSAILDIIKYTLGGIAFVTLLVGALGIINTMFVIVTEKTKEIGIMKSVGARNRHILFLYITQAGLFGFFGAILGVILGSLGGLAFEAVAKAAGFTFLEITIDPRTVISLLLFGFIVGAIAGFLPAYRASKLDIVEALRK